jgi:hypothetical protein
MTGLVPVIHVAPFRPLAEFRLLDDVDDRDKPGHDDEAPDGGPSSLSWHNRRHDPYLPRITSSAEDHVDSRQHALQLPTGNPADAVDELMLVHCDEQRNIRYRIFFQPRRLL